MYIKNKLISVVILVLIFGLVGCNIEKKPIRKTGYFLGIIVTITVYDNQNEKILDKAFKRIEEIENRMSVNKNDSDISIVNRNAGIKAINVHNDVYYVLKKAKTFSKITNGAFDPTIGPIVDLWGIGTENARVPSIKEIKQKLPIIDYNKLELMNNNMVYLKTDGMKLDLGGIAKGYAADEVNRILEENGIKSAVIDLGGNIFLKGVKPDKSQWRIGIQNPFDTRGNYIGIISASNKSIVTSGNYERYFEKDGVRYHHILDTDTGYPVDNEVASVSVISDYSIDGDALSTALFALGVEKGLSLIENLNKIEAIFITKDKKVYASSGIISDFTLTDRTFQLINQ